MRSLIGMVGTALCLGVSVHAATDIYVAPTGNDSNSGSISAPLKTLNGARLKVRGISKTQQVNVYFRKGTYPFTDAVSFSANDSGTTTYPVRYSSAPGETAFFDGGRSISLSAFSKVTGSLADRLPSSAVGKVWSAAISDTETRRLLSLSENGLTFSGKMFIPTRSPNKGYFNINVGYSSGLFMIAESTNFTQLKAEVGRNPGQGFVHGYVTRQYAPYTIPIKNFTGGGNAVFELDYAFPSGISLNSGPRIRIKNMLATLDAEREWYFDTTDNRLYIYPPGGAINTASDTLVVWGGKECIHVNGASNLNFERFVIQHMGGGTTYQGGFRVENGNNANLRGCTLRRIASPSVPFELGRWAKECTIDSCDVYDNGRGSRLQGGSLKTNVVEPANNMVYNCHFTKVDSDYTGDAINMGGHDNTFKNNLVHNSTKQPIYYAGNDQTLMNNEVYNVGQEEGDGGAIYCGANLGSYGTVLKNNFVHHIMNIPGLIRRNGLYSDDFDGGDNFDGNILYKAGAYGIYTNKGGGHYCQNNVAMATWAGIWSGGGGTAPYDTCMNYLKTDPTNTIKANYIGGLLRQCGVAGWENSVTVDNWNTLIDPFWTDRYPTLAIVLKKYNDNNAMRPYETRQYDNWFNNCDTNVMTPEGAAARDNVVFSMTYMEDPYTTLNFNWKSGMQPAGAPNINMASIGLQQNSFRTSIPNAGQYRSKVRSRFHGQASYTDNASYTAAAALNIYYNSGVDSITASQAGLSVNESDAHAAAGDPDLIEINTDTESFQYDLGTASSAVFSGYTRLSPETHGDVNWNIKPNAIDRGTSSGANDLNRDLVYSGDSTLNHKVKNGNWEVLMTFGDAGYAHDDISVYAEGALKLSNIDTTTGNTFFNKTFEVDVSDGSLTLRIDDAGGSDPNWVATRINLTYKGASLPPAPTAPSNAGAVANSATQITVTWNDNSNNETAFRIDRKIGTGSWVYVNEQPVNSTTYINTGGVTEGTEYTYRVYAVGAGGNSGYSNEASVTTPASGPTQAPYGGTNHAIPGKIEGEHYDTGGEGVSYHDTTSGNAGTLLRSDDVDIGSGDGGQVIGWTAGGEWLEYTVNVTAGTYTLKARVGSPASGKTIVVKLNGATVTTVNIPNTGSYHTYQDVTITGLALSAANNAILRLEFPGNAFNLNWLSFEAESGTPTGAPVGTAVALKSVGNGKYVCADNQMDGTNRTLLASRTAAGVWETFQVKDAGGGYIYLVANVNNKNVKADSALSSQLPLAANSTTVGDAEKFTWVKNSDNSISLKSKANGKYICADRNLSSTYWPLAANRTSIGGWERFTWEQK